MVMLHSRSLERITKLPAFSQTEMRQVNGLIQNALLSSTVKQRLLSRDSSLQAEFELSTDVWAILSGIKASSIADFCGEINLLQQDI